MRNFEKHFKNITQIDLFILFSHPVYFLYLKKARFFIVLPLWNFFADCTDAAIVIFILSHLFLAKYSCLQNHPFQLFEQSFLNVERYQNISKISKYYKKHGLDEMKNILQKLAQMEISENDVVLIVGWSHWTAWSCSVTCGNGTESRTRKCLDAPAMVCVGDPEDQRDCQKPECPSNLLVLSLSRVFF